MQYATQICETVSGVGVPYHWDTGVVQYNGTTTKGWYPMNETDTAGSTPDAIYYATTTQYCYKQIDVYGGFFVEAIIMALAIGALVLISKQLAGKSL